KARIEGATVTATTGNVYLDAEVLRPSTLPGISATETMDAQIWAFAVAGSLGSTGTGAGSISLNWIRNTVDAHISSSASVTATAGNVTVHAADQSTINSLAGSGAIGVNATASVGASIAY